MRKLKLNPEKLEVESFETALQAPQRGTVAAHATLALACGTGGTDVSNPTFCAGGTCEGTTCDAGRTCWSYCYGTSICVNTQYPLCLS